MDLIFIIPRSILATGTIPGTIPARQPLPVTRHMDTGTVRQGCIIGGLITIGGNYHVNGLKYEWVSVCVHSWYNKNEIRSVEIKYA